MTNTEKQEHIQKFGQAYELIESFIKGLPEAAYDYLPDVKEAWSIREHLVHLRDGEVFAYERIRLAVAEPGATVFVWDEVKWRERLAYGKEDPKAVFLLTKEIRMSLARFLESIAEGDWESCWILHPVRGRLSLVDVISLYRNHVAFHVPYIKRNRDAWLDKRA